MANGKSWHLTYLTTQRLVFSDLRLSLSQKALRVAAVMMKSIDWHGKQKILDFYDCILQNIEFI